ncbi:MAG: glycosyltransferase family 4 protein [Rhodospirillales bacterium]|nr:glycosyltransferase family 4 protein [Rhodospirillales bacterium]
MESSKPRAALVLPPREAFAPGRAGAIGLILHALAGAGSAFEQIVVGPPQPDVFAGVSYRGIDWPWWPGPLARRYAHAVAATLRRLRPAIVEVHNRPELALHLARSLRVPVILVLHNRLEGRHAAVRAEIFRQVRVATVSDWLRHETIGDVPGAAATVLPNPIDLATIPTPRARRAAILFAGRIVADKGADAFVAACALALPRLPGWTAAMIGADRFGPDSPPTPYLNRLRAQAQAAGVAMAGYQPHEAVLAAMAEAAIVVVPSRWPEPFGMVALEALACGAALAYAPRGGLPEVVGAAGVTLDPDDPPAMAATLVALAGDPDRRAMLAEAGRAQAGRFALPAAIARLDALRTDVLAAWPPGRGHPI